MRTLALLLLIGGGAAWWWSRRSPGPGWTPRAPPDAGHDPAGSGDGSIFLPDWMELLHVGEPTGPSSSIPSSAPRGIRNNNPGNIRRGADSWRGLAAQQPDPEFCTFTAPEWGLRAMGRVLLRYQAQYGLRSVNQMVSRWAPPSENNTAAYVAAVAADLGVRPDDAIDLNARADLFALLLRAIVKHENGPAWADYYSPALYAQGVSLALSP